MAFRLPAVAPFRYQLTASTSSRATPTPVAYIRPSRNMTWALPPSASRRSVCRKSPPSAVTRHTSSSASVPGVIDATRWRSSVTFVTGRLLRPTTISPKRNPACPAGLLAAASRMSTPLALGRPSESASGSSSASICTPSQPFCGSLGWPPIFTVSLTTRPCGWRRLAGRRHHRRRDGRMRPGGVTAGGCCAGGFGRGRGGGRRAAAACARCRCRNRRFCAAAWHRLGYPAAAEQAQRPAPAARRGARGKRPS